MTRTRTSRTAAWITAGILATRGILATTGILATATLLTAGVLMATATPLSGQSALEEVERLTRLGRTEEARVALADWWEGDRAEASRGDLQRGLWLRGRLTVDPVQAELDFQRLVVLYPSGRFTPDALLRLAQGSWAMGEEDAARSHVATLQRDHPGAEATRRAARWLADAGPVPPPGDTPSRSGEATGETRRDTPPRADAPSRADARPRADGRPGEDTAGPPMNYSVQLGAFAEPERAAALYESTREQGVDARLVRVQGSQFVHIRVGRFAQRSAAVELLDELTARGINAALVRDDRPEELIRPR